MTTAVLDNFLPEELKIKWTEQYVSEALNRNMGVLGAGNIFRGFRLTTTGTAMRVNVQSDIVYDDHAALARSSGGDYVIGIQRQGSFELDLTAFANKNVAIYVEAFYTVGNSTSARISATDVNNGEPPLFFDSQGTGLFLGTVKVPASGVIANTSISNAGNQEAWMGMSSRMVPPYQFIKNGVFRAPGEKLDDIDAVGAQFHNSGSIPYWYRTGSVNRLAPSYNQGQDWPVSQAYGEMTVGYVAGGGAVTAGLVQDIDCGIGSSNSFSFKMRLLRYTGITAGTLTVTMNFLSSSTGTTGTTAIDIPLFGASVDPLETLIEQTFSPPSMTLPDLVDRLVSITIQFTGVSKSSTGYIARFTDVMITQESDRRALMQTRYQALSDVIGPSFWLRPSPAAGSSLSQTQQARGLLMTLDPANTEPVVDARRKDGGTSNHPLLNWRGRVKVGAEKADKLDANVEFVQSGTNVAPLYLIWSSYLGSAPSGIRARMYVHTTTLAVFLTINAVAQTNATLTWSKDTAGVGAYKFNMGSYANSASTVDATGATGNLMPVVHYRSYATGGTWGESGWEVVQGAGEVRRRGRVHTGTGDTIDPEHSVFLVSTASASQTVNLPSPGTVNTNREIIIQETAGMPSSRTVTLHPAVAGDIGGNAGDLVMNTGYQAVTLWSDGTKWWPWSKS